jgi:flagellar biosynthesis protein
MDKSKKAIAIKYDKTRDRAPRITAKGKGAIAFQIIEIAQRNDVPLYEDQNLARLLDALDLNMEIPPQLYRAVAEVLVFIYRLNSKV